MTTEESLPWPVREKAVVPKDRPTLGARVRFTRLMKRVHTTGPDRKWWATWVPKDLPFSKEGVYVGHRVKKSGWIHNNYEDGSAFVQTGSVSVALVVTDEYKNPVEVAWEGME